jgi:hypothetical protein
MTIPIQPGYVSAKANAPIELGRAPVEVVSDGARLLADGTAVLRLAPRDRVIVTARFRALDGALPLKKEPLTMRYGDRGEPAPVLAVRTSYSDAGMEMDLLPQRGQLIQCADRRVRLREAVFHILNFPEFFCLAEGSTGFDYRATGGGGSRLGRVVLAEGGWLIEIQALPGTSALIKQLKEGGGSAITHVGRITRAGGRSFSIRAAEGQVHNLHRFLSFARGHYTGLFGVTGRNEGGVAVYEQWGILLSTPWESGLGWFDVHHGQSLAQLYPGFVSLLGSAALGRAAARALYWYLRSNRGGEGAGIDSGLLLSQAALERLSHAVLKDSRLTLSGKAGARIRRALAHLGMPVAIPSHLKRLRAGKRSGLWEDGPEAIVKIRNELVHAEDRLGVSLGPAIADGWRLAQWYVELMILRLSGYSGVYSNRLNPGWVGEVESVPWAKKAKP